MSVQARRRAVVLLALAGVAIIAAAIIFGGKGGYVLYAQFRQAGGLRQGFTVRLDGAPVGKIEKLELDKQDLVVAKLRISSNAAPVGRDARATARAADLLGEKFIDLAPGNRSDPAPSGVVIPPARTGLAVELDDVINAIDLPTREALRTFVNEQGDAFVGRGRDLAATLAALPPSLDRTGALLDQFGQDNRALGRLVEESDRVVGRVAQQRASMGRFVTAAAGTLDALASRHNELGQTVRNAPAALAAARRALASLEGAAIPLGPAARGLAATAPQLTATLNELPAVAAAARPTLAVIRRVAPTLQRLGRQGAPVTRHLAPLTGQLDEFATAFEPVTQTLDAGAADVLGVLEGWARSTQARDTASHVFRFGLTVSAGTFSSLAALMNARTRHARHQAQRQAAPAGPQAPQLKLPEIRLPQLQLPQVQLPQKLSQILNDVPHKLGLPSLGQPIDAKQTLTHVLDYLLK
jgi:phospholipid/cholesterol/gamma-HCH transport system substrate-binding protein